MDDDYFTQVQHLDFEQHVRLCLLLLEQLVERVGLQEPIVDQFITDAWDLRRLEDYESPEANNPFLNIDPQDERYAHLPYAVLQLMDSILALRLNRDMALQSALQIAEDNELVLPTISRLEAGQLPPEAQRERLQQRGKKPGKT